MDRGRPITNRANYFTGHHWRLLWKLANQITAQFPQFEAAELVNVGWLLMARRYESAVGISHYVKVVMYRHVRAEITWTSKQQPTNGMVLDKYTLQKMNDDIDTRDELRGLLRDLTNREITISLKSASGWRNIEIAKELGFCPERIRQLNNITKRIILERSQDECPQS